MCRLMVYLGTPCLLADLVTKPSRSLTRQSYDAKERLTGHGYLNGDGFGIGWYSPEAQADGDPTPCMFSSIQPAWNNRNLERLANKIMSPLIFAHVRAAYPGIPVSDANCQVLADFLGSLVTPPTFSTLCTLPVFLVVPMFWSGDSQLPL